MSLHNGDHAITVFLDAQSQCFLLQRPSAANYSCFLNVFCTRQAEAYLMPLNPLFLWHTFLLNEAQACIAMDTLDEWRSSCERLPVVRPSAGGDHPTETSAQVLANMVMPASSRRLAHHWGSRYASDRGLSTPAFPPTALGHVIQPVGLGGGAQQSHWQRPASC